MRSRLPLVIVFLPFVTAGVALAVPQRNFSEAAREYRQAEEEKQLWLKPDLQELKGDFITRLQKEAAKENTKAEATLALCYHIGFGVPRDLAKAVVWYQKAAGSGHAAAQNNLGHLYDSGKGVPLDHSKAHELYLTAAQQGFADAQFNVGLNYAHGIAVGQDWQQAKYWYEKAAAQGHLAALNNLGGIFLLGHGVPADNEEARRYLLKPAQAGWASSQYNLAASYISQQNFADAAPWLRRSAEGGYPGGQFFWADCLWEAKGVARDPGAALKWARKATESAMRLAPDLVRSTHNLSARVLIDDPSLGSRGEAFREANAAAVGGDPDGENLVGICYHRGIGVDRDLAAAIKWYRLAAEQKNVTAATTLGVLLELGNGVPRDLHEAARWFRVGAEGGDTIARYRLGLFYRDGTGVETNLDEALRLLRLASQSNPSDLDIKSALTETERQMKMAPAEAAFKRGIALGQLAHDGHGSMAEAINLVTQAADLGYPKAIIMLASIYRHGEGVPKDEARADALLEKVGNTSDPVMLYMIADTYLPKDGRPLENNIERVVGLLRRSAAQGLPTAQNALGYYYMSTADGNRNVVEAFKWLSLGAAGGDKNAQANLDRLRPDLFPAQIEEGKRRASAFRPTRE